MTLDAILGCACSDAAAQAHVHGCGVFGVGMLKKRCSPVVEEGLPMLLRASSVLDEWMVGAEMRSERDVVVEVVERMESDGREDE